MIYENEAEQSKSAVAYYDLHDFNRPVEIQSV